MKNVFICIIVCLTLGGCVTPPIPNNYSGPIASIRDTAVSESSNRAQFFFLSEIDGQKVDNVLIATRKANSGRGFSLMTINFSRDIPARPSTLTLEGRIGYGAPIQAIVNAATVYTVEKKITFTPESNKSYIVKGTLTATNQDVWLEDANTGTRIKQ